MPAPRPVLLLAVALLLLPPAARAVAPGAAAHATVTHATATDAMATDAMATDAMATDALATDAMATDVLATVARSAALPVGRVGTTPVWIATVPRTATAPSAAVLSADGAIWWVDGGGVARGGTGVGGEQLVACGGDVLAVDVLGRLHRHERGGDGPRGPVVSLLHLPLCLDGASGAALAVAAVTGEGDVVLLDHALRETARVEGVRALPDAEVVEVPWPGGRALAVLADPTQRYRVGALGDEVEAASIVVLALPGLEVVDRWTVEAPAVIEDRRPTPWRHGRASGVHVPVSEERHGARLVTLAWQGDRLVTVAAGAALGGTGRWLHVLGVVADRVYVQHDPHGAGPLVRHDGLTAAGWAATTSTRGLALMSHEPGERNLDRAAWVRELAPGVDLLALPRSDADAIAWVRCDAAGCAVAHETTLASPLATNLALVGPPGAAAGVLAAGTDGSVWWSPTPALEER